MRDLRRDLQDFEDCLSKNLRGFFECVEKMDGFVCLHALHVHLNGHVDVNVLVDVLVDVTVNASVDVFVDVFIYVFVDATVDVFFMFLQMQM